MKKILFLIIILLLTPTLVNAETNYLYDVLKNEAENFVYNTDCYYLVCL